VEIQQLKYFITVAECLNFTKAASRHFMAQTAISYQIKSLEQELGFKLFQRDTQHVMITPAGMSFYEAAISTIKTCEQGVSRAKAIANGFEGTLRLGFLGPIERNYLPPIVSRFRKRFPQIEIIMAQYSFEELRLSLEQRLLDVVFTLTYGIESIEHAATRPITRIPIRAFLYKSHRFATRPSLKRSELADEEFVFVDRQESTYIFDGFVSDCMNSGFSPHIVAHAKDQQSIPYMVEAEIGIALFPESFFPPGGNLCAVPLEGENEYVQTIAAWHDKNNNPAIPLFISVFEED
jgi:DNA-binding transcriptional LysR family regulator